MWLPVKPRSNRGWLSGWPIGIDTGNPIAAGLLALYLPGISYGVNLVSNKYSMASVNSPPPVLRKRGLHLSFLGASAQYMTTGTTRFGITSVVSSAVVFTTTAAGAAGLPLFMLDIANARAVFQLALISTPTKMRYGSDNGAFISVTGSKTINDGLEHCCVGVYDGAHISGYCDGVLEATTAKTGAIGATTEPLLIAAAGVAGGASTPNNEPANCTISMALLYNRGLSPAEGTSLSFNPYQILIFPEDVVAAQMSGRLNLSVAGVGSVPYDTIWWSGSL